jgi:hypothetical protein
MEDSIKQFKWSTGEKYEQSFPTDKEKYMIDESKEYGIKEYSIKEYDNMKHLLFDDGKESCMRISNKREDANTKLNERCMIESISQNPFLPRNNYINDLQIQDEFLKPKNSNFNIE